MKVCSIDGCDKPSRTRGFCGNHYQQMRKRGHFGTLKICTASDCERHQVALGYCATHYRLVKLYGKPERKVGPRGICCVDGCSKKHFGHGYCKTHYSRFTRGKDLDAPVQAYGVFELCTHEGCDRVHACRGLCKLHYERMRINGDPRISKTHRAKTVEEIKWREHKGYVYGSYKGQKLMQHRFVWEQHHGRVLHPFENIHHINGIRHDNRIENLELWTKAQPAGQRPEDLVKWVVENYADLVAKQMKKGKGSGRSNSQTRTRVNGMAKASTSRRGR